MLRVIHSKEV